MNGSAALVQALKARNVGAVFNLPGGQTLSLLSALAADGEIRPVFVRHEQAAAFAALAYAKVSGRPGVCVSVPGPGATNMVTGTAAALADRAPFVVMTPQIPLSLLGRSCIHDGDIAGIYRATTKAQVVVDDANDLGPALVHALDTAMTAPLGPVHFLFEASLLGRPVLDRPIPDTPGASDSTAIDPADVDRIVGMLNGARRPVFYVGDQVVYAGGADTLVRLAERCGALVMTDESARGVISEDHPLAVGTAATRRVKDLLGESDLCLAVGTAFPEWSTEHWCLPLPRPLIHIADNTDIVGRNFATDVAVVGPIGPWLSEIYGRVSAKASNGAARAAAELLEAGASEMWAERRRVATVDGRLHPLDVVSVIRHILPRDAIVCADGSATAQWLCEQAFPIFERNGFIHAEVLKETGSALCRGLGAKVADPDRPVVVVSGDGGFLFQLGELSSLVQNDIKLTIVLFDDGYYNADRIHREHVVGGDWTDCTIVNPNYRQLMSSFGLAGCRVSHLADLGNALAKALADPHTALVAVAIDPLPVPYRVAQAIETRLHN